MIIRPAPLRTTLAILLPTLLGAALRFYRLDLAPLGFDQTYPLQYAQQILQGHFWGAQPHGSVAAHPAAYIWVITLPYLISHSYVFVLAFRVALDVLAVALCAVMTARHYGRRAALLAGLFFAAAPWALYFARNTWPVPQPLFSVVLMFGLLEVAARRNPLGWALSGIGVGLCAGAHFAGVYALPAAAVMLAIGIRSFRLKPALVGALLPLAVAAAYVAYDQGEGYANLSALAAAIGSGGELRPEMVSFVSWMSGGAHLSDLTGIGYAAWQAAAPAWLGALDSAQQVWFWASLGIGVVLLLAAGRARNRAHAVFLLMTLLWLGGQMAAQLRSSRPVQMQYLTAIYPAPFLLMGVAADWLMTRIERLRAAVLRPAGLAVMSVAAGLVVVAQAAIFVQFIDFVGAHATEGGHGPPARGLLAARAWALAQGVGAATPPLTVFTPGFPTLWNEQATIARAVLADVPFRMATNEDTGGLLLGPRGGAYLAMPGADDALQRLVDALPASAGVQRTSFTAQPGGTAIYTAVRVSAFDPALQPAPAAAWQSGVSLSRYRAWAEPGRVRASVLLRVEREAPPSADFHWYVHAYAGDDKIGQADIAGVHPSAWRTGDWLLLQFDVPLDAGKSAPTHIRLGSYTFPGVQPVMLQQPGKTPEGNLGLPLNGP